MQGLFVCGFLDSPGTDLSSSETDFFDCNLFSWDVCLANGPARSTVLGRRTCTQPWFHFSRIFLHSRDPFLSFVRLPLGEGTLPSRLAALLTCLRLRLSPRREV